MSQLLETKTEAQDEVTAPAPQWKTDFYWVCRILWACRVSVASALAGLLLFGLVDQAQNLFADRSFDDFLFGAHYWLSVFVAIFLVWAFPVHYGARRVLEDADSAWMIPYFLRVEMRDNDIRSVRDHVRRRFGHVIAWTPRLLGLTPFVAVALGLMGAQASIENAAILSEATATRDQIWALLALDAATAAAFVYFVVKRQRIAKFIGASMNLQLLTDASLYATTAVFVSALIWPFFLSDHAPRALIAPFLLGSLVLGASWLVRKGYETGRPLLLTAILFAAAITAANTRLDDVRTLPEAADALSKADRQIDITEAVRNWKAANGCAENECPPALIVAAEGGASRAAYMAATVVGHLIDRDGDLGDGPALTSPGRRVFAFSGVSGGAFGSAIFRAALSDVAEKDVATPPCVNTARVWVGAHEGRDPTTSWRDCLQLLVSGDYLSPTVVGLGFRDNFSPRKFFVGDESWMEDRAALLEKSWERHYDFVTNPAYKNDYWTGELIQTGEPCASGATRGMCRRLGYARATPAGKWAPLLLLNGTSVDSGTRIIGTDLISTRPAPASNSRAPLYPAAYDFFEMISTPCKSPKGDMCPAAAHGAEDVASLRNGPDILLSTAALLSARFPVISPAGALRTKDDATHGDRIVDGGYFDNAGLASALDVARALKGEGVTPLILWVQNDPVGALTDNTLPPRAAGTPRLGATGVNFLSDLFGLVAAPVDALLATRAGHAAEQAALAQRSLVEMNADTDRYAGDMTASFFQIGVRVQPVLVADGGDDPLLDKTCARFKGQTLSMSKVSMSWWLSQSVQADLDAQLCDKDNRQSLKDLITRLKQKLPLVKSVW
ncbi:hypothetical protein IY145_20825 [Methylosinus sp. H3A]|uniref:hypothetical protein n=1 Tax=Methylosinus sp. H3A TaxID=2785786 RepID=UPI0018C30B77|nr:hypothetical protein [Methylosinus sp. H3A]MBG0811796.1 hypothetical protein [Methylosinus sp. H3A]